MRCGNVFNLIYPYLVGFLFSSEKRGTTFLKSVGSNLVFSSIDPIKKPLPSGLNGTKPMPNSSNNGVTSVLIVGRILAAYGAVIVTLIMRNFIMVTDSSNPGIKGPMVLGWSGMPGVVSLAAVLSIPVYLEDGIEFPQQNLILFITFIVILSTLLL